MELIDRYVYQVSRRLPKRLRDDVRAELRSLLLDALEESTGRRDSGEVSPSIDDQVAVLKEFSAPAQMAAKYQPRPQYIVGPRLYNLYLIVVAAVIGAGFLASIVSTAVSRLFVSSVADGMLELLYQGTMRFLNIAISGIGSATLVFAVLERVIPDGELRLNTEEEWNPRDLPEIEERSEVKTASRVVQIGIMALLLIAFIAFPDRIGAGVYYDGGWHVVPSILSPEFFSIYLPLIDLRLGLAIILNLVLLRQARWQLTTRVADLLLRVFDIYILARMLLGPSILSISVLRTMLPIMQTAPLPPVTSALKLALFIALVGTSIETVIKVIRTLRSHTGEALPPITAQVTVP